MRLETLTNRRYQTRLARTVHSHVTDTVTARRSPRGIHQRSQFSLRIHTGRLCKGVEKLDLRLSKAISIFGIMYNKVATKAMHSHSHSNFHSRSIRISSKMLRMLIAVIVYHCCLWPTSPFRRRKHMLLRCAAESRMATSTIERLSLRRPGVASSSPRERRRTCCCVVMPVKYGCCAHREGSLWQTQRCFCISILKGKACAAALCRRSKNAGRDHRKVQSSPIQRCVLISILKAEACAAAFRHPVSNRSRGHREVRFSQIQGCLVMFVAKGEASAAASSCIFRSAGHGH